MAAAIVITVGRRTRSGLSRVVASSTMVMALMVDKAKPRREFLKITVDSGSQ
jgi:hypothetical protein